MLQNQLFNLVRDQHTQNNLPSEGMDESLNWTKQQEKTYLFDLKVKASKVIHSYGIASAYFSFLKEEEKLNLQGLCRFYNRAAVGRVQISILY